MGKGRTISIFLTGIVCTLVTIGLCFSFPLFGQNKFTIECLPGAAATIPSKLFIYQRAYNDLEFIAHYKVEPFKLPVYYSLRAGYILDENSAIELELNHLKIYLKNKPEEVQRFSVTHGYNQIWINYVKEYRTFHFRLGVGPVIAHRENTIRGKPLPETGGLFNKGYHFDGITSQIAIQKRFFLREWIFLSIETKYSMAYAKVDVVDGYAKVPVFAFHGLFGFGFVL